MTRALELAALAIAALLIAGLSWMGVYLIITEHYWWAWIPFLMASCVSVKWRSDEPEAAKEPPRVIVSERTP